MPGGRRAQRCPGRGGGRAGCGAELPLCLRAKFGGGAGAEALPRHLPRARRALLARCSPPGAMGAPSAAVATVLLLPLLLLRAALADAASGESRAERVPVPRAGDP